MVTGQGRINGCSDRAPGKIEAGRAEDGTGCSKTRD
jgi:hypothetical protein